MLDDRGEHVSTTLDAMVRAGELPGAQYLAVTEDAVLRDAHAGLADAASARPMTRDTLQMAYSVTKAITAVAVMQLVDQGKLALDAPLSATVPDHPYGDAITIRMLLAHTAGVPNPMPLDWFAVEGEALDRRARLRALLAKHDRLASGPGAKYGYTNLGYWLLEEAIERASGEDYGAYVEAHVFGVLGVGRDAATFDLPPADRLAVGHARRWHPMNALLWAMTPSRYWAEPSGAWSRARRLVPHGRAYGGLYCSAAALAPVLQDLLKDAPTLLSPASRDALFVEARTTGGEGVDGGLGFVLGELEGVPYAGKQGGGFGSHGNVRLYRSIGLATVFLANRTEIAPGPIDARSDALDRALVRERSARAR